MRAIARPEASGAGSASHPAEAIIHSGVFDLACYCLAADLPPEWISAPRSPTTSIGAEQRESQCKSFTRAN